MNTVAKPARRVLVTGGAGFIGSHLAARCVRRGDEVHVAVRPGTALDRLAGFRERVVVHELLLGDRRAVDACLDASRPDTIFHLAANTRRPRRVELSDAAATIKEDIASLLVLLTAAAETSCPPRALVRTGSLAEYGPARAPYVETQRENPVTPYAAALVSATHYTRMLQPRLPFAAATARLALVYGSGQRGEFLVPQLIERCLAGDRIELRRPQDRRDLLHVDDAVDGLLKLADSSAARGGVFNLSTGEAPMVIDIAREIVCAAGADPACIQLGHSDEEGIPDFRASPGQARLRFGWSARTGFRQGLALAVEQARVPSVAGTC